MKNLTHILKEFGFHKRNTLLATSLCCDEVNRELEHELQESYGDHFAMGGLAGFPFGGVTAFGDMAHHIPTNGHCIVIFGPHVGIDEDGVIGKVHYRGRLNSDTCCTSAAAAASYVSCVHKGVCQKKEASIEALDAQQVFVSNMLLPYGARLDSACDPAIELPVALYDAQRELMNLIIEKGCGEISGLGKIALLGGIQINTPAGSPDYFIPICFELLDNKGNVLTDLSVDIFLDHSDDNMYFLVALALCGFVLICAY